MCKRAGELRGYGRFSYIRCFALLKKFQPFSIL